MGYRGKTVEKERARDLRAESWTLQAIASELGVSRSSVSVWVRDVRFEPKPRHRPIFRNPSSLHLAKLAQIEEMNALGVARIGVLSDDAFLAAGVALYAGEGSKWKGCAKFGPRSRFAIVRGHSGVAQLVERSAVNRIVESSSLSPGAFTSEPAQRHPP